MRLKNTPTVYVKIFNFACDNFYRKTLSNVTTNVDLEGLVPEHQQQQQFSHASQLKFDHTFKFPELDN